MSDLNQCTIQGRLTRDPELKYLPSQTPVCEFSVASSHKYKKANGEMVENPCFVECKIYGKRAEVVNKYFAKGDPIIVRGRLNLDRWEAQDGSKRSKHTIFVEDFHFAGGKSKDQPRNEQTEQPADKFTGNCDGMSNDDIPF